MVDDAAEPAFPDVGDFTIREQIGTGAFADVYRVAKGNLGSDFALKRWRETVGPDTLRKFHDECQLQFRLRDHPNIVRLHWCETPTGAPPWLVTELYDESLEARLARGKLDRPEAVCVIDDLLAGLVAIHAQDHVHRDVKPANVLLKNGRAALTDLGLALRLGERTTANAAGTFPYAAPELARGVVPSTRSDVYSAATTIARALGEDLPAPVEKVLDVAQSQHPADRPADAADLRRRLTDAFAAAGWTAAVAPTAVPLGNSLAPSEAPQRPTRPDQSRRRAALIAGVALLALASAAVATSGSGSPRAAGGHKSSPVPSSLTGSTSAGSTSPAAMSVAIRGGITSPADGTRVEACSAVFGTAGGVPAGWEVWTAYRYTNKPRMPDWYFQPTRGTVHGSRPSAWHGEQYWGGGPDGTANGGARFRLVALAVPHDFVVRISAAPDNATPTLPTPLHQLGRPITVIGNGHTCPLLASDSPTSTAPATHATHTPTPRLTTTRSRSHPAPISTSPTVKRVTRTCAAGDVHISIQQTARHPPTYQVMDSRTCTVPHGDVLEIFWKTYDTAMACGLGNAPCYYDKGLLSAPQPLKATTTGISRTMFVVMVSSTTLADAESQASRGTSGVGGPYHGTALDQVAAGYTVSNTITITT